jgi:hypothetical protein
MTPGQQPIDPWFLHQHYRLALEEYDDLKASLAHKATANQQAAIVRQCAVIDGILAAQKAYDRVMRAASAKAAHKVMTARPARHRLPLASMSTR